MLDTLPRKRGEGKMDKLDRIDKRTKIILSKIKTLEKVIYETAEEEKKKMSYIG